MRRGTLGAGDILEPADGAVQADIPHICGTGGRLMHGYRRKAQGIELRVQHLPGSRSLLRGEQRQKHPLQHSGALRFGGCRGTDGIRESEILPVIGGGGHSVQTFG